MLITKEVFGYSTGFDDNILSVKLYQYEGEKDITLEMVLDTPIGNNRMMITLPEKELKQLVAALNKAANDE